MSDDTQKSAGAPVGATASPSAAGLLDELRELLVKLNKAQGPVSLPVTIYGGQTIATVLGWLTMIIGFLMFVTGLLKMLLFAFAIPLPAVLDPVAAAIISVSWISAMGFGLGLMTLAIMVRLLMQIAGYHAQTLMIMKQRAGQT
jgi:hypothetical protein